MAVCRTLSMDTEIPVLAFGKKNTKNQDVFVLTNINSVLLIGLIPVIPACLIAGILLSKFFRKLDVKPPTELHEEKHFEKSKLPDLGISIFTMLIPVLLMLFGAIVDLVFGLPPGKTELLAKGMSLTDFYGQQFIASGYAAGSAGFMAKLVTVAKFFSDANMALMMAVLVGMYTLGIRQGKKIPEIIKFLNKSVGAIAMIILIIATDGTGYRLRKFDVFAFQRYWVLDVQGILQRQHQTNLCHLDSDGMFGGHCRIGYGVDIEHVYLI